jgi:hypothetical protein
LRQEEKRRRKEPEEVFLQIGDAPKNCVSKCNQIGGRKPEE